MSHLRRALTGAVWLGLAAGLAGCGSFDPTDWFNNEKPLPGERHLVFPEGVPGVPQGVPRELVKGNQPEATETASTTLGGPAPAATAAAVEEPKAKPKAKPRSRVASRPKPAAKPREERTVAPAGSAPTQVRVQPPAQRSPERQPAAQQPSTQTAAQPAPAKQDASIWGPTPGRPATGANAPWPAPAQTAPAPWPDAPSPNQFSR